MKNFPPKKTPDPEDFTVHLKKKKILPILCDSFRKEKREKCFPNSFYESGINLITKSDEADTA